MIRREDVADLQPGDVVELTADRWDGGKVTGPLRDSYGNLACGPILVRFDDGEPASGADTLAVVSRAPRPLYVNSPRTEPVPGDVVRDEMTGDVYVREHNTVLRPDPFWWCPVRGRSRRDDCINLPLTLLIDAETGEVVQ